MVPDEEKRELLSQTITNGVLAVQYNVVGYSYGMGSFQPVPVSQNTFRDIYEVVDGGISFVKTEQLVMKKRQVEKVVSESYDAWVDVVKPEGDES